MQILNDKNFIIYCAQNYQNPACSTTDEFYEDLKRIKYIKKLCTRYVETGELKERLILNHVIVLSNVFKPEVLCRILYLKMASQFSYVKPFLIFLGICLSTVYRVRNEDKVDLESILMDPGIIKALRAIRESMKNVQT
jgi:hypothetical protein